MIAFSWDIFKREAGGGSSESPEPPLDLTRIELHIPLQLPFIEVTKILLQNLSILQAGDCQVNGRVVSKQPYLRLC